MAAVWNRTVQSPCPADQLVWIPR
eukprot:COSAG03_NODE_5035_length_1359_cov_1.294444_2_plen_23_part_01